MTDRKERLTVTVDPEVLAAGNDAVAAGRAASLSGWVNQAMAELAAKERHLVAMGEAIAAYEKAHGAISDREIAAQLRSDLADSITVRGARLSAPPRRRSRGVA